MNYKILSPTKAGCLAYCGHCVRWYIVTCLKARGPKKANSRWLRWIHLVLCTTEQLSVRPHAITLFDDCSACCQPFQRPSLAIPHTPPAMPLIYIYIHIYFLPSITMRYSLIFAHLLGRDKSCRFDGGRRDVYTAAHAIAVSDNTPTISYPIQLYTMHPRHMGNFSTHEKATTRKQETFVSPLPVRR